MADVTVTQFADVLKVPVDRLLVQLEQAGITVSGPDDMISDEAKMELLSHLRRSHGTGEDASAPRKITLKRKTQTELKLASTQGRARTVNVEVRVKRTYVKRDVLEEQNRAQQEQADQKRKELEAAQNVEAEKAEAERREQERLDQENRRRLEEEQNRSRQAEEQRRAQEQRDKETAEIAVQAALTGHLVFSTLHTNDSASAITRLVDMGVKPFLVAASVQAVLAQRLLRVVCKDCRQRYDPSDTELRSLGIDPANTRDATFYRPGGCPVCEHSGYRGRLGIYELLQMDETLREMTFRGEPMVRLRDYAWQSGGMSTLLQDGVRKVMAGQTTIPELLRVVAAV